MTFADFLYQAGFWQWIGLLLLGQCVAQAAVSIVTILFRRRD
jgi:hypothetical protein